MNAPVAVCDLCEREGLEVRFLEIPSFEGLYSKTDPPCILLSSLRPFGRQNFTCAHELGHHCFKHGEHLDVLVENSLDPNAKDTDEFIADRFAATLLMAHLAIDFGFNARGWKASRGYPHEYYVVASWLGVGYTTLINHLAYTLKGISSKVAEQLKLVKPKDIRSELLGNDCRDNLILLDEQWLGRAVDIQVGDTVILPSGSTVEGSSIEPINQGESKSVVVGRRPGISRVEVTGSKWSVYVRVSRNNYVGRSIFRFLEDGEC